MKKTIRDLDVAGKRVMVRADLNAPIADGRVSDDARILAALPTLQHLIEQRARIILVSHLGRPDGFVVESLRMNPIADRLAALLRQPVLKVNNCIGPEVQEAVRHLEPGQVLVLENVRFHPGELVNDLHFAARLAEAADIFVSDAFASAHRAHASNTGIAQFRPAVAGLLMESELEGLERIQGMLRPPVVALLGGSRLLDKAGFIEYCLTGPAEKDLPLGPFDVIRGAQVLTGGVIANTLLYASGLETGQSDVEKGSLRIARELLGMRKDDSLRLPEDVVIADALTARASFRAVPVKRIRPSGSIVDIGPRTVERYLQIIEKAGTVIWNGPLGAAEIPAFAAATNRIAEKIASLEDTITIVGGGDTTAALDRSGFASKVDYLSTGGAALLAALRGRQLPGVAVLQDAERFTAREKV